MAPPASETKVAIVGPNGDLGGAIIKHLLQLKYSLTLITRNKAKTTQKINTNLPDASNIQIEEADYSSTASLVSLLKGHHVVAILINRDQIDAQILAIDAAIEAGVEQIIPSSFGIDTRIPAVRANPALAGKVRMEDHFFAKLKESGTSTTYTVIQTGIFLDWALSRGFVVNFGGKGDQPTVVFDTGDAKVSMSSFDDIAKAVGTAIQNRKDESVRNKFLLMHSIVTSQNEFLAYARELKPEKPWPTVSVETVMLEKKSREALEKGETSADAVRGFLIRNTFGEELGLLKKVDNDVLGVEEKGGEYIKGLLAEYLQE